MTEIDGLEAFLNGQLRGDLLNVAAGLRRMADEAIRLADEVPTVPIGSSYSRIASQMQHSVLWGVANLSLDSLTRTAGKADAARAKVD